VSQLVSHHLDRPGESPKQDSITVTKPHPGSIPERIAVVATDVDAAGERHSPIVKRIAVVDFLEVVPHAAGVPVGFPHRHVTGVRIALGPHQPTR
jgi:hypothetical protein